MTSGLPDNIRALAKLHPVERLVVPLLRTGLSPIQVVSKIAVGQTFPIVMARRRRDFGNWAGDARGLMDSADVEVHSFCEDPNGDDDAATLAEAARTVLTNAWRTQLLVPNEGYIARLRMTDAPRRAPDWATATGPVQYADLPVGVWRYEAIYHIDMRPVR